MNSIQFQSSIRLGLTPLLMSIALGCQARPVEIDLSDLVLVPLQAGTPGMRPESAPARLRCWQRGVNIVDEALQDAALPPASALLTAPAAGGRQLTLIPGGTSLCLLLAPRRSAP